MIEGMKRVQIRGVVFFLAGLLCLGGTAIGQSTDDGVMARLKDKPLFIKGFLEQDKLSFDADGKPSGNYHQGPFTLAGFDLSKVKLTGDKLVLEGERMGLAFNEKGDIRRVKLGRRIHLEIDGHGNTDFTKALDHIFAESLAEITPFLPSYWQDYAQKRFVLNEPPADVKTAQKATHPESPGNKPSEKGMAHVGGSVKAPRPLSTPEPMYTDAARVQKYSGNVQVYLWVGEDGVPSHLRIMRPLGLGLDEQALASVQQYRFAPATQDGKPVKVDLYINVNFQIF